MNLRQCSSCGQWLNLDEFSFDRRVRSGRQKRCRRCTAIYLRDYRKRKGNVLAAKDRERSKRPERKAQQAQADKRRRLGAPEKIAARKAVHRAIRSGKLQKERCVFCGSVHTQAHHADYTKPLEVVWVCGKCHRQQFHSQKDNQHEQ